ncbi:YpoC family protein [Macrococcus capreoli]|uniref:YpoC family protein n=1 Tax=Macrococcus capreoli TaxID=2982690 RepID=UPI003EE4EC39
MKERMKALESLIDAHSRNRTLSSHEAQKLLDEYFNGLLYLMHELNDSNPVNNDNTFEHGPLNFNERLQYIEASKYHFMGYQQMKTMCIEIQKMLAIKNIKKKRQH